jgi:ribosomal protein S12 methylthiotransferase
VDAEVMAGILAAEGWTLVAEPEGAEAVVVNTCAFLEEAVKESVGVLRDLARLKTEGRLRHLVVAGCLGPRMGERLLETVPEVDAVVAPAALGRIGEICRRLGADGSSRLFLDPYDIPWERRVVVSTGSAYLKIAEGCDRSCTFCIIPRLRGPQRSRPPEALVEEARRLVANGVRELVLVAQDTTAYGRDLEERVELADLLEALDRVDGVRWIRLLYTHPAGWNRRLMEAVRDLPRVLPYVDIPLQHTREPILRAMRRGVSHERTRELLQEMRETIPGLVLRTTILVGFPGESEADFEAMREEVLSLRFPHLGVFPFSPEPEAPAAALPGAVAPEVARSRRERLLEAQRSVALAFRREWVGREVEVLVERDDGEDVWGRVWWQAPEIDGEVRIPGAAGRWRAGEFLRVRILGTGPYDLVSEPTGR